LFLARRVKRARKLGMSQSPQAVRLQARRGWRARHPGARVRSTVSRPIAYHVVMRFVRRHDLAPRMEMIPLIDVIFLLLTFFIYSLALMVQAQVLPVALPPITT